MEIERIKNIANKTPTYNKDINQHIESCKISLQIINQREDTIKILREMLRQKDEKIGMLEENNLTILAKRREEINSYKNIIRDQYKLIQDLDTKNKTN